MSTDSLSMEEKILGHLGGLPGAQEAPVEEAAAEEAPVDDGFDDLDWEGQTIRVPKGLKEAVMRTDDYTRKTQELAEQRKTLEQLQTAAQQQMARETFERSITQEKQEIAVIDAYLAQARKMDMTAMTAEQMFRAKMELDSIKERRSELQAAIDGKHAQFQTDMQNKLNELRGKTRELASKSIQGFNEETEKAMREFAKTEGLGDFEIDNVLLDPRSYKIVWKAMQFEKVRAGVKPAEAKAERVLKPGAAGERMPAKTAANLNFNKAMKSAKTSSEKANVIEARLMERFGGSR